MARPLLLPAGVALCGQCARILLGWSASAVLLLASGLALP